MFFEVSGKGKMRWQRPFSSQFRNRLPMLKYFLMLLFMIYPYPGMLVFKEVVLRGKSIIQCGYVLRITF